MAMHAPLVHTSRVNDAEMLRVQAMWRELTTARLGFFDNNLVYKSVDSHRCLLYTSDAADE